MSPESMSHALTRDACAIGKNQSVGVCGSCTGFSAIRLGGGGRWSGMTYAPPQVGGVTLCALEVGVSKKHPTTLLLFYVLPKILSKIFAFSRANSKPCSDTM